MDEADAAGHNLLATGSVDPIISAISVSGRIVRKKPGSDD